MLTTTTWSCTPTSTSLTGHCSWPWTLVAIVTGVGHCPSKSCPCWCSRWPIGNRGRRATGDGYNYWDAKRVFESALYILIHALLTTTWSCTPTSASLTGHCSWPWTLVAIVTGVGHCPSESCLCWCSRWPIGNRWRRATGDGYYYTK